MENQPFISIIVPVHNSELYLEHCLHSLLCQTYPSIEILLIENDSSDKSPQIIEEAQKNHPNLIRSFSQKGGGAGGARNRGMKEAKGQYLMFVDADDFILFNTCEIFANQAFETNADLIAGARIRFVEKNFLSPFSSNYKKNTPSHLRIMGAPSKIYKLSWLKENEIFFPENSIYEDILFYFRTFFFAKEITIIDFPVYFYRVNLSIPSSSQKIQHQKDLLAERIIDAILQLKKDFKTPKLKQLMKEKNQNDWKALFFLLKKSYITSFGIIHDKQSLSRREKRKLHQAVVHSIQKSLSLKDLILWQLIKVIYAPLLRLYHTIQKVN